MAAVGNVISQPLAAPMVGQYGPGMLYTPSAPSCSLPAAPPRAKALRARLAAALALSVVGVTPVPVLAHPHLFIDAGIEMMFDDEQRLAALRVVWVYDAFYSMMTLSDLELDSGFSGELTDAEKAALQGFDMQWMDGFDGDIVVHLDDAVHELEGPAEWTADYVDGRIVTSHLRLLTERVAVSPEAALRIQVYDPTYYTAYTIVGTPQSTGRDDCAARIFTPDWEAADAQLMAVLSELAGEGVDAEVDFPAVGEMFSEEIRVTCAASS